MEHNGLRNISAKALGVLLASLAAATPASGGGLDEILRRGAIRWGGDQSGGAPYVYEGPDGRLMGFEYDLMEEIARKLGVRSEFVQGQWDKLPQLIDRGDVDVVANGYEWSEERERHWTSTVPYYVYRLQLLARKGDGRIQSWEDLRRPPRKKVGVLIGSAAERYLEERFRPDVEIVSYDGVTNAMTSVVQGQLDATLQDLPIAIHYASEFPQLVRVGEPVAPGCYVIFLRKGERALKERLDRAIADLLEDGTLRRIYEKYGLWDEEQAALADLAKRWPPPPGERGDRINPARMGLLLARSAVTTIALSVLAMPLAIILGLFVATGRLYGPSWMRAPLEAYVEFLRGTPVLLQLYVIYYVLPNLGIVIPAFWAGVIGLAINYSAYEAENYRAGFLAVPKGQMEAALSLGMTKWTALRRIIIPQAVRIVIPPVTNDFIALFKDTSVCSVITVVELTGMYNRLSNNQPRFVLELGLATAALYLLMSYPLSLLVRRLERRMKKEGS